MILESQKPGSMQRETIASGVYCLDAFADGMIRLHVMTGRIDRGGVAMTPEEARNVARSLLKCADQIERNQPAATV